MSASAPAHGSHHHHGHDHHHHHHHHHHHNDEGPPLQFDDPAQESLRQALRAGFNVLRVIMVVLLVAYFFSGPFEVKPGQQGLIVRFGKLLERGPDGSAVLGPGWHFALPDPFDRKIRVESEPFALVVDTFLFDRPPAERGKPLGAKALAEIVPDKLQLTPGVDGAMLSGDRNLSYGLWTVEYRVVDGAAFVRNIGEERAAFDPLLRALAEAAIIRSVAGRTIEDVLKFNRVGAVDVLAEDVRRRLTQDIDRLGAGVEITRVVSDTIEPGAVRGAFTNVSVAQQEREKARSEAQTEYTRVLNQAAGPGFEGLLEAIQAYGAAQTVKQPQAELDALRERIDGLLDSAQGEVASTLARARTRATELREDVRREVQEFTYQLDSYRRAPLPTVWRLWGSMRREVLSASGNEPLMLGDQQIIEMMVNRDPQRVIDAERERFLQRNQRPRE